MKFLLVVKRTTRWFRKLLHNIKSEKNKADPLAVFQFPIQRKFDSKKIDEITALVDWKLYSNLSFLISHVDRESNVEINKKKKKEIVKLYDNWETKREDTKIKRNSIKAK